MITGQVKKRLTIEAVLSKITDYDIYRYFCPEDFAINQMFPSPMPGRSDRTASFVIGPRKGRLKHWDFGDSTYRGDCFDFVMQINMLLDTHEALKLIDKHFGLGLTSEPIKDYRKEIITYEQPVTLHKQHALVQVAPRSLKGDELKYWAQFHQSKEDLELEGIYGINVLLLNKQRVHIPTSQLAFAYKLQNKWKIYRPFADKKLKWYPNSIYNEMMEGKWNIDKENKLIIAKSRKDRLVLQKVYPYVCSVQSEHISSFTIEDIDYIKTNSTDQYVAFDSDAPGKKNSREVTAMFNFNHVNVPDEHVKRGIKDFAEMGKQLGLQAIADHLTLKGIL